MTGVTTVAMAAKQTGLVLVDDEVGGPVPAAWAGNLLGLGARLERQRWRDGWQLVVAVSLPTRDYAALLVGAGWVLTQPGQPAQSGVLATAEAIPSGTPVRMATALLLVADRFYGVDRTHSDPRVHVGGTFWKIEAVDHIAADPALSEGRFERVDLARPGSLVRRAGRGASWSADQCASRPTVAIVGTRTRLEPELAAQAGWAGSEGGYDSMRDILRPDDGRSAFCASAILPGGREYLPEMRPQTRLAVLDGATAIRWLPEVRTQAVVALIDRSSTDESAGFAVLQRRSVGQRVDLSALGWEPFAGMEALAFEVPI